jgi:hypothetical protein
MRSFSTVAMDEWWRGCVGFEVKMILLLWSISYFVLFNISLSFEGVAFNGDGKV